MSDDAKLILGALAFVVFVTVLVLWLRRSDRGGSSYRPGKGYNDGYRDGAQDAFIVDAVIDVVSDLLDD